jgi:hypothetical protein
MFPDCPTAYGAPIAERAHWANVGRGKIKRNKKQKEIKIIVEYKNLLIN